MPGASSGLATAPATVTATPTDFTGFAPVYYPGTFVSGEARTVTLGVGEERSGIDVPLQLVCTASIRGTITDRTGRPATNVMVQLVNADPQLGPAQSYQIRGRPRAGFR